MCYARRKGDPALYFERYDIGHFVNRELFVWGRCSITALLEEYQINNYAVGS
jgi:hypothetical protein